MEQPTGYRVDAMAANTVFCDPFRNKQSLHETYLTEAEAEARKHDLQRRGMVAGVTKVFGHKGRAP